MTAEPDLLPLRDWMECLGEINAEDIRDYARANVAHATAAKDAEIEALRAEVEFLRRGIVPRDDDMIVPVKLLDEINASGAEWKDRAERLAEALRERRDWFEAQAKSISKGNGSSWDLMQVREQRDLCDAALEQEAGRG